nr:uncharacterized protein LOC111506210 [Leptinotarsa decemlineata]
MPHCKEIKLGDVWRTCNKIRAAIFRMGINLFEYFAPLDPHKNCLISESQFISVINGQLRATIGLSEQEVAELADYFRVPDGRIYYTQLCEVIHDSVPKFSENAPLVSGLEWEDPLHTNRLSISEERRLSVLLTKIASLVNMRKIILRPYFQDYELVRYLIIQCKNFVCSLLIAELEKVPSLKVDPPPPEVRELPRTGGKNWQSVNPSTRDLCEAAVDKVKQKIIHRRILLKPFLTNIPGKVESDDVSTEGMSDVFEQSLSTGELSLSSDMIDKLKRDPCDPTRVCWRTFEDDIDQVFTVKELEKVPSLKVDPPPPEVRELPRTGGKNWQSVNPSTRDLCEAAVDKVKQKIILHTYASSGHNNGHVSRSQMRQALHSNCILLSDEELFALEERFNDDVGFNYFWFLKDVEFSCDEPLYTQFVADTLKLNKEPPKKKVQRQEQDIVKIMAKIKGKVVRERIRVMEFLRDFDRCNEQVISRDDFKRGLSVCRFDLSENEVETLMEVFASPLRRECVDYKRFSDVVEEAFTQQCLERAPLLVPIQHVPTRDCEKNFLNFDERIMLSVALQKLSKKPDLQMNLSSVLQDFDKTNCGTVSRTHFLKALTLRGMSNLISRNEFDVICKCFSFERGMRDEVDYRAFMKALEILYATEKYNPF